MSLERKLQEYEKKEEIRKQKAKIARDKFNAKNKSKDNEGMDAIHEILKHQEQELMGIKGMIKLLVEHLIEDEDEDEDDEEESEEDEKIILVKKKDDVKEPKDDFQTVEKFPLEFKKLFV